MPVADPSGGVIDRLLGLEDGVQIPGGSPCAVGKRHRGAADEKQVAVDSLRFQVVRELAQHHDDVVPGQHDYTLSREEPWMKTPRLASAAGVATNADACRER